MLLESGNDSVIQVHNVYADNIWTATDSDVKINQQNRKTRILNLLVELNKTSIEFLLIFLHNTLFNTD